MSIALTLPRGNSPMRMYQEQHLTFGQRVVTLLLRRDIHLIELIFGSSSVLWGTFLLLPIDTFASTPSFRTMATFPEWAWGFCLALLGILQFMGATYDQARIRQAAAFGLIALWGFVAISLLLANPASTGPIAYGWTFTGSEIIVYWRLGLMRRE